MSIGIIGKGIVGSALEFAFTKLGETVKIHDIKLNTKIEDILDTEAIFICVPTPMNNDGSCNTKIVEEVISNLLDHKYSGYIVIKSTIIPGTTQRLINNYQNWNICYSLETLRERCATTDMVENQKLLAIGTDNIGMFNRLVELHGNYPQKVIRLHPTEAELLKYMHNTINALRVTFANEFYDIAQELVGVNYTKVKNALLHSTSLPDIYLDVNNNMRSWSSICWNKDIPAICKLGKDLNLNLPLLYNIEVSNNRHEKTAFAGTRENYND